MRAESKGGVAVNRVSDWTQRKQEIGTAFRRESFLAQPADASVYDAALGRMGIVTNRDVSILLAIVQDAIMMARREALPTTMLDRFRDWLMMRLVE